MRVGGQNPHRLRGTVTSLRRLTFCLALAASLLIGAVPVVTATSGTPIQLSVSQAVAFSVLGHSCGGIQEQSIATGFDATTGNPTGVVYMQTRCGGSGRGGGYHTTTYSAWLTVTWDFGANLLSYVSGAHGTLDPTATYADVHGDQAYTTYNTAVASCATSISTTCNYHAWLTGIAPNAPTNVHYVLSGGQYTISWTPDPATAAAITSSTITAVPDGGTAVIVTPVSGNVTSALLGPLAPSTTYYITVTNTDAAGTGAASDAIQITTGAATTKPGRPKSISIQWAGASALLVSYAPPTNPGDSPIDQYQIKATAHDADAGAGGPFTTTVDGTTLTAQVGANWNYDWAVKVRAHNAAGWGPWSKRVIIPAGN